MKFLSKYQFHLISCGILALVIGFLFQKPLTGEYTFGGPDSLSPSAVYQGITAVEEEYGKYPLWLPWIFSGLPSIHSFQNISDYYFPNYFMDFLTFFGIPKFWNYIFHFILAGMGVFAILRKMGTSGYSALFGGLSFGLMPYLITMVVHGHGSQMMTTAWLPWIIWSILRLYEKTNLMNLGILGIMVGFQMQRAHVQIAYYSWMAAGLLVIMLLFNYFDKLNKNPKWIIYTGFAFTLGLCMAMWIYLPAMNYTPYSIRGAGSGGGTGFDYATAWSFSFGEMATFFIPSFYGFGGSTYWGIMPFTDYPNYMGIIVLSLAVIGALFHEGKFKWYFVITAFLALLLSFGRNFFLYQIFYDYFPYFNKFRVPTMFLILTQFSVAILAGLGLETSFNLITTSQTKKSIRKLTGVLISIIVFLLLLKLFFTPKPGYFPRYPQSNLPLEIKIIFDNLRNYMINFDLMKAIVFLLIGWSAFYIYWKGLIGRQLLAGIIIIVSLIDMALVDRQIIEPSNNSYRHSTMIDKSLKFSYLSEDEVIRFLKQDKDLYRILPVGALQNENRWSAFQIESVTGYHPAKIFRYNNLINPVLRVLGAAEKKPDLFIHLNGILKMLNIKYVISLDILQYSYLENVFSGSINFQGNSQKGYIYEYKYFIPRAFFARELQLMSDLDDQLNFMIEQKFNPEIKSIVEHKPHKITYNPDSKIEITNWSPDKIELDVSTPTNQFLILSEIFYPEGWKITSHPNWEIHPVNTILRGVYIPAGSHRMVMEFIPDDIYYGSILTWGSTAIIIIMILSGIFIRSSKDAE